MSLCLRVSVSLCLCVSVSLCGRARFYGAVSSTGVCSGLVGESEPWESTTLVKFVSPSLLLATNDMSGGSSLYSKGHTKEEGSEA